MPGFDAEFYLRCAAEDALRHDQDLEVGDRARALVAVGALTRAKASSVLAAYAKARALRGHEQGWSASPPARGPVARRVCGCAATIEQPWGTVRLSYVSFTAERTEVGASVDLNPDAGAVAPSGGRTRPHGGRPSGFPGHPGPPAVRFTDDQNHSHGGEFGGSASDDHWWGVWMIEPGLSTDSSWIELLGTRVELTEPAPVQVEVEHFELDSEPAAARAERHLEHRLEVINPYRQNGHRLDTVIDTLIACGALTADSPVIPRTRMVAEALINGGAGAARDLSPRWRSILRPSHQSHQSRPSHQSHGPPGRRSGADRSLLIGITTPEFDGQRLSIMMLEVTGHGFEFDFRGTGSMAQDARTASDDGAMLGFTASDDRGNHYLGRLGSHGRSGSEIEGTVEFTSPLDPDATELELAITTDFARATVRLGLPWADRP